MHADDEMNRLDNILQQHGVRGAFNPATPESLARAAAAAPMPPLLQRVHERVDLLRLGEVELFQVDDFIEVNENRVEYGELAEAVFFADDLAEGYFFVDPTCFMGISPGYVFWVERGAMTADHCVPAAASLIDFLESAAAGNTPWKAPDLGERAVVRLCKLLDGARTVEMRPPLDPAVLTTKAPTRGLPVPWGLAGIWEHCDGFLLVESSREFFGFDKTEPVASTDNGFGQPGALWTGRGPEGERYATTVGNWLGLPADRLLSAAPGQNLADALLLGRTADVWAHWIRQDEAL